jgi:hypothetical protein
MVSEIGEVNHLCEKRGNLKKILLLWTKEIESHVIQFL